MINHVVFEHLDGSTTFSHSDPRGIKDSELGCHECGEIVEILYEQRSGFFLCEDCRGSVDCRGSDNYRPS